LDERDDHEFVSLRFPDHRLDTRTHVGQYDRSGSPAC
jgi:hypothetical protein